MNRKQRPTAQSQTRNRAAIRFGGGTYAIEEADALAIREYALGHVQAALDIYRLVLAEAPGYAAGHNNYGIVLHEAGRYADALAEFDAALSLNAGYADAHNNRGLTLHALERYAEALASCDQAILLKPDEARAHNNRGNALLAMNRHEEALAGYDKAVALNPSYADAHNNRGNALRAMNRYEDALAGYDKAIMLNPKCADAYNNRGHALWELKRYKEALTNFEKGVGLKKPVPYLPGTALVGRMHLCQWQGLGAALETLASAIETGQPVCSPFAAAILPLSPAQQKRCAEIYVKDKYPPQPALWKGERYAHDKIRLGYFSADFHNHATAYLAAGLFELHDRARFEVMGFSFGHASGDAMRQRLTKTFDRFFDVRTKSDLEIAQLARALEIDIAIDLKGFTQQARPGIFAPHFAPVQVSYLGYPGTMGAGYIDYLIADPVLIPESHRQYYTEKIACLPGSYQVNDSSRKISDRVFTRRECGLPEAGFVFCCFNNNYKITPDVFDIWMRLLRNVPGSVLWLYVDNATAAENLRVDARLRGIDAPRLVFAGRMEQADHLARHRLADLFLDTSPCNAHTTASDALWAGLPVLTCLGTAFAGRVAASLLNAIGLPELVAPSQAEYEALALELATQPEKLSFLRRKLAGNRTTQPLFNTALFTRHIESAYRRMWKRYQAGLPPEHLS